MKKRFLKWLVVGFLAMVPVIVAGCGDLGSPNDVTDAQEKMRMNRGIPGPTELPPGLGDDLPPATTQPQTVNP